MEEFEGDLEEDLFDDETNSSCYKKVSCMQ